MTSTVMILDDEPSIRRALSQRLKREGYKVLTAGNFEEYTRTMTDCDVVLCDIILPSDNGLRVLEWTRHHYPLTPVVLMTGKPSYQTAAEALRLHAYDYLAKPVSKEDLLLTIDRAVQHRRLALDKVRLEQENEAYRLQLEQRFAEQSSALREFEQFLANVTNTMADALFTLTWPQGRIKYVNRAVFDIFGYQPGELVGEYIHILFVDPTRFALFKQQQLAATTTAQSQLRFEESMRRKDGQFVWIEMIVTFIRAQDDKLLEVICVARDITQRTLLLGVVSHELRSPLGLISGFSQAILRDLDDINLPSLKRYLEVIDNNASRMLKMIDELLDITRIQLGKVSLQLENVNLNQLLAERVADYGYVAHKKRLALRYTPLKLQLDCRCDPAKISQVVSNFIDNAIKYSNPNTTIEVISRQQGEQIWVGVKDQGPGIKPEELQHLFKSFGHNKISSRPTAGEKSSGLGLAISKNIVEAHRGEIGVNSQPGQGSTFWFTLPVNPYEFSINGDANYSVIPHD